MYLRRNDIVLVLKGKDRLKTGKILRVDREVNRAVVEGVNMVKRHRKASGNVPGGILSSEAAVNVSNLRLLERPDTDGMSSPSLPGRVAKRMQKRAATATPKNATKAAPKAKVSPKTA